LRDFHRFAGVRVDSEVALKNPEPADVFNRLQRLAPREEVLGGCGLVCGVLRVQVIESDDAFSFGERKGRIGDPLNCFERTGAHGDRKGHRQSPDDGQRRIPDDHPDAQFEIEP
jgi:hypothetical protein